MRLDEIHIEGFGIFHDRTVGPLSSRFSLIEGPNEAGKSTLRDFVRALFFGFETGRGANRREPLDGGRHGGRATVVTANGERFTVSVLGGKPAAGVRMVTREDGGEVPEEYLTTLLGGISRAYFESVHAFGLGELQELDSLIGPEISDYLFGATAGVMPRHLDSARKALRQRRRALLKSRGGGRIGDGVEAMRGVRQTIRGHLADADMIADLTHERAEVQREVEQLDQDIVDTRAEYDRLDRLLSLEESWRELRGLEVRLGTSSDDVELTPEVVDRHHELRASLERAERSREWATQERNRAAQRLEVNRPDTRILDAEAAIQRLDAQRPEIISVRQRVMEADEKRDQIRQDIDRKLDALGPEWSAERVHAVELRGLESEIEAWATKLVMADTELESVRVDLEAETDLDEDTPPAGGSTTLRWLGVGFVVLGLAAGALIVTASVDSRVGFVVAGLLALGLLLLIMGRRGSGAPRSDRLDEIERDLVRASRQRDRQLEQWRDWLRAKELDETMTPEDVRALTRTVRAVRAIEENRLALEQEVSDLEHRVAAYGTEVDELEAALANGADPDLPDPADDPVATAGRFKDALVAARRARDDARDGQEELTIRENELSVAADAVSAARRELGNFYAATGCHDAESFEARVAAQRRRRDELDRLRILRQRIVDAVGLDDPADLESLDFEVLTADHQATATRLRSMTRRRDERREHIGGVRHRVGRLRASDALARARLEEERLRAALDGSAEEWSAVRLAEWLLDTAITRFQEVHQPAVLRRASRYLAHMTADGFERVFRPLDGSEPLICVRDDGERLTPDRLSRGTREQVYLALRFAVIRESVTTRPPVPVVLDDILVNFDVKRAARAVEVMAELSETHQVLYFTCHPHIARLVRSLVPDAADLVL